MNRSTNCQIAQIADIWMSYFLSKTGSVLLFPSLAKELLNCIDACGFAADTDDLLFLKNWLLNATTEPTAIELSANDEFNSRMISFLEARKSRIPVEIVESIQNIKQAIGVISKTD